MEEKAYWFCYTLTDETQSGLILMPGNTMYVLVEDEDGLPADSWIHFTGVKENLLEGPLNVTYFGGSAGIVTLPGFYEGLNYPTGFNLSHQFLLDESHVIMISFLRFQIKENTYPPEDYLELYELTRGSNQTTLLWSKFGTQLVDAEVYNTSLELRFVSQTISVEGRRSYTGGFQLLFSFFSLADAPKKLASGFFDCSGKYESLQRHLGCNLRRECEGWEDEGQQCPYGSDECRGALKTKDKCISYHAPKDSYVSWLDAKEECARQGLRLAALKTMEDFEAVQYMTERGYRGLRVFTGLFKNTIPSSPAMYRAMWSFVDGTACYNMNLSAVPEALSVFEITCSYMILVPPLRHFRKNCLYRNKDADGFLCERRIHSGREVTQISTYARDANRKAQPTDTDNQSLDGDTNTDSTQPTDIDTQSTDTKTQSGGLLMFKPPKDSPKGFNTSVHGLHLVLCPGRHFVHSFMQCDMHSSCGVKNNPSRCELKGTQLSNLSRTASRFDPPEIRDENIATERRPISTQPAWVDMFQCNQYGETLHYTLVCNFRRDCRDGSDESRCVHLEHTSAYRCSNGQSIEESRVCDMRNDCYDGSDEAQCPHWQESDGIFYRKSPPVIINMDGRGNFNEEKMDSEASPCPDTHFRCPGAQTYCMPVYLRCNGVKDCPEGEDEVGCDDDVTCPGYFRCRSSSVCLHGDHLCDGWPQCPERDDELLCDVACPSACHYQGLAFVCQQPFAASHYPDLRYLDATGSGMVLEDVADNFYLVYLSLSYCRLETWPNVSLPNVQHLDLSYNSLTTFDLQSLSMLMNLRSLRLSGNPVTTIVAGTGMKQTSLIYLDLSNTSISTLDSQVFSSTPSIQTLNLSFSELSSITKKGFSFLPALETLDVRGSDVEEFPGDLFEGLTRLHTVHAKNYKLCCKATLPENFNTDNCFAPLSEVSSCEDLLRSDFYRAFLWTIGAIAVFGNAGSTGFKLLFQRKHMLKSGYNVFVTSLSVSDFLMGVYLFVVGVVDEVYRGEFLWHERSWRDSGLCKAAGFLSLLSNEVSAFMICLITLDRLIVIQFPFSQVRFKGKSAVVTTLSAWVVGLVLAAIPLVPSLSHWSFYGQTGICIPLPVTRNDFSGKNYSFGVMIVLNFILFVLIAVGQASIYWSIRSNSLTISDSTAKSQNLTVARRLITVVVSDFLCWFPIGVLGFAAFSGVPVPGEVNVALAVFVLPLNSALNPFLYTYNMLMEKRRLRKEAKLLEFLKAQMMQQQQQTACVSDHQLPSSSDVSLMTDDVMLSASETSLPISGTL